MGASVSQEINAAANQSISVLNSQTNNCVSTVTQEQAITVCTGNTTLCPNGTANIDITGNSFTQATQYTTQCSANINVTTDIQAQINQAFTQQATAIAQQFQLSAADVNNVSNVSSNIATNISTTTVQNCITQAAQSQGIQVSCSPNGSGACNVTITGNTFDQGFAGINDCILQDSNAQTVIANTSQAISQSGTAKIESLLGPIIAIIIIIIVILGGTFFGGTKALGDWRLWVVVIVLVILYLGIAFWQSWFPFG